MIIYQSYFAPVWQIPTSTTTTPFKSLFKIYLKIWTPRRADLYDIIKCPFIYVVEEKKLSYN